MSSDHRKPLPPDAILQRAKQQIVLINSWTSGLDVEAYVADELRRYAVERAFIALGEAVKDLNRLIDLQTLDPDGPWREPARFRDFLAHDYDDQVIPDIVWATISHGLPDLARALERVELALRSRGRRET